MQVWIVQNENGSINVVATATDRETAKMMASGILREDPDKYTVTPATKFGTRTILLVAAEVMRV